MRTDDIVHMRAPMATGARRTQEQVGDACGVDKTSVGKYENGVACMDYETAWDMANLYGVSLDDLGGRERGDR